MQRPATPTYLHYVHLSALCGRDLDLIYLSGITKEILKRSPWPRSEDFAGGNDALIVLLGAVIHHLL